MHRIGKRRRATAGAHGTHRCVIRGWRGRQRLSSVVVFGSVWSDTLVVERSAVEGAAVERARARSARKLSDSVDARDNKLVAETGERFLFSRRRRHPRVSSGSRREIATRGAATATTRQVADELSETGIPSVRWANDSVLSAPHPSHVERRGSKRSKVFWSVNVVSPNRRAAGANLARWW
jgi:hypothetical protein